MKYKLKKGAAAIASLTLAASVIFLQTVMTAVAATENTEKEEVIYVNLNDDGSVDETIAVNIFDLDAAGTITDYGEYSNVEVLNTTDDASYTGSTVTIDAASAGKVYYEGTMPEDTQIPWDISISYKMDGVIYTADEIAGMSGALEMHIVISENTDCSGDFFDDYALQMTVTLDTDLAQNIAADGATVANAGGDKQLSYTILSGEGGDFTITADVTDFEMDAIAINGVQLSLDIEVDDEEILDQITELVDAIGEIDDGSSELADGVSEINDGVAEIQDALDTLSSQSSKLTSGSSEVLSALEQMQSALDAVSMNADELSALVSASAEISSGIDSLESALEQMESSVDSSTISTLKSSNSTAISQLQAAAAAASDDTTKGMYNSLISLLQSNNTALDGLLTLDSALGTALTGAQTLQESYAQFDAAIGSLTETVSALSSSMTQLADAVDTLTSEYKTLDNGISDYTDGVSQISSGYQSLVSGVEALLEGSEELSDGTAELREETDGMDEEITDQIDELIDSITGEGAEATSFVSSRNTEVEAVQFVIQTRAIEIDEPEEAEAADEESTGFLQKLLGLFGL